MPTYAYKCDQCHHEFEKFQSITARPIRRCPQCGRSKVKRLVGTGAGILFKGSGFYQTDYRSDTYNKAAEGDKGPSTQKDKDTSSKTPASTQSKISDMDTKAPKKKTA